MALALARKYRPKSFAAVAVQSHVSNTLKGAIARGRVAHGYLFCGPRGTGKTTLARVLAMALNCERRHIRDDGEPCGECESCRRIWSGSANLDVVEIDAASNRGVDDARDLRERAMYAPSGPDRYKVYIVDEAHMLTREAWNALLKILEEPPPRVVFAFATTEPQKIAQSAAPVLSRLQRFDLKRIPVAEVRARLASVLDAEGVAVDAEALAMLARAADGSMRDALSLTDQVLAIASDGGVTAERVREALGVVAEDEYIAVLDLLASRRAGDVFATVGRLADQGVDFGTFLGGLADMLRALLAVVLGGEAPDLSDRTRAALVERRAAWRAGELVRMLSGITEIEPRFRKSGQQRLLLETMLVRFALLDRSVELEDVLRELGGEGGGGPGKRGDSPPPSGGGGGGGAARPVGSGGGIGAGGRAGSTSGVGPRAAEGAGLRAEGAGLRAEGAGLRAEGAGLRAEGVGLRPDGVGRPEGVGRQGGGAGEGGLRVVRDSQARETHPQPQGAMRAVGIELLKEQWGAVVGKVRGKSQLLGTVLEHAMPVAVASETGDVTVRLNEPNEIFARALESNRQEIATVLREMFGGVGHVRIDAGSSDPAAAPAPVRRLTAEGLRVEQVASLRKRDALLNSAIDALDLELMSDSGE
jgi:DNA polymerase III subunit gamma/tau